MRKDFTVNVAVETTHVQATSVTVDILEEIQDHCARAYIIAAITSFDHLASSHQE